MSHNGRFTEDKENCDFMKQKSIKSVKATNETFKKINKEIPIILLQCVYILSLQSYFTISVNNDKKKYFYDKTCSDSNLLKYT